MAAESNSSKLKFVIVPGNGECDVNNSRYWYIWIHEKLQEHGLKSVTKNMPDPVEAKESIWLPFMEKELQCDANTVIVGHSSGAEAAMRYAETHQVYGIVLVSACTTDQGHPSETISGYYNRPWQWEKIKANVKVIGQFGSEDDPYIPWAEMEEVAEALSSNFHRYKDRGHFVDNPHFPELLKYLLSLAKEL